MGSRWTLSLPSSSQGRCLQDISFSDETLGVPSGPASLLHSWRTQNYWVMQVPGCILGRPPDSRAKAPWRGLNQVFLR